MGAGFPQAFSLLEVDELHKMSGPSPAHERHTRTVRVAREKTDRTLAIVLIVVEE
jgi:hypothetical protein